jgi:hypothetical protein
MKFEDIDRAKELKDKESQMKMTFKDLDKMTKEEESKYLNSFIEKFEIARQQCNHDRRYDRKLRKIIEDILHDLRTLDAYVNGENERIADLQNLLNEEIATYRKLIVDKNKG